MSRGEHLVLAIAVVVATVTPVIAVVAIVGASVLRVPYASTVFEVAIVAVIIAIGLQLPLFLLVADLATKRISTADKNGLQI
jgi:hypothetical protein